MREGTCFRSLVVPVDLTSDADRVLPLARALAQRAGLAVHLVSTISPGLDSTPDEADLEARAAALDSLTVTTELLPTEDVAWTIASLAATEPDSLLCLVTHARTALGEVLLGSVTDHILRATNAPVLVAGPQLDPDGPWFERLLVCVDPYALAHHLVDVAARWQRTFDGSVEVFEAIDELRVGPAPSPTQELVAASDLLDDVVVSTIASRDPVDAILEAADAVPGTTICMASHVRPPLERAVLGSVAWEVLRRYDGPVLLAPPAIGETP